MRANRFPAVVLALTLAAALSHVFRVDVQAQRGGRGRSAQSAPKSTAWFGVTPAPGFHPETPPAILGTDYGPRPVSVPAGEERFTALKGDAIRQQLQTIVGFSK